MKEKFKIFFAKLVSLDYVYINSFELYKGNPMNDRYIYYTSSDKKEIVKVKSITQLRWDIVRMAAENKELKQLAGLTEQLEQLSNEDV